jgi:transmembrane sensor
VRFSAQARDLELLEGEALFAVKHDSSRPFRVKSAGATIQAVGTQFNVYRRAGGTMVSVVEGKVVIEPAAEQTSAQLLAAGEEASIAAGGRVEKRAAPDVRKSVAWRERRLVFRADRLEDVVTEVNRYSKHRIRVEGDAARNMKLSAIFDASDPESLLRFLGKVETLWVDKSGEAFVVRSRAAPSP